MKSWTSRTASSSVSMTGKRSRKGSCSLRSCCSCSWQLRCCWMVMPELWRCWGPLQVQALWHWPLLLRSLALQMWRCWQPLQLSGQLHWQQRLLQQALGQQLAQRRHLQQHWQEE